MNGTPVSATEWSERLNIDATHGEYVETVLRDFHERALVLREPLWGDTIEMRQRLQRMGIACVDAESLALQVAPYNPDLYGQFEILESFGKKVWDWGGLYARPKSDPRLIALIRTAARMLESNLLDDAWTRLEMTWAIGTRIPRPLAAKLYESFSSTILHIVVIAAVGDEAKAEAIAPWGDLMLQGNFPLDTTRRDTFAILTR